MRRRGSITNKPGNVYFLELLDPSKTFDFPFYKIGITENAISDVYGNMFETTIKLL